MSLYGKCGDVCLTRRARHSDQATPDRALQMRNEEDAAIPQCDIFDICLRQIGFDPLIEASEITF